MWHTVPEPSGSGQGSARGSCLAPAPPGSFGNATGLRIDATVRIARFFDALLDASYRIRRRQPVSGHLVHEISDMPFVSIGGVMRAEFDQARRLAPGRQRQLVSAGAEAFLHQTATRSGVSWIAQRRPELVMKCEEVWGVYALEAVRRLSTDDERPNTYRCASCSTPVILSRRPKDGDVTYCRRPECQRARWRQNKRRQRHQLTGDGR